MHRIYLDYAATTPMDPVVRRAMEPYFSSPPAGGFGNPSSLHSFGQKAIAAVDQARETIAREIGAGFREIIFTGSATEANNLAIRGVAKRFMSYDLRFKEGKFVNRKSKIVNPRIIISAIEHESVRETAKALAGEGVEVVEVPVDRKGAVSLSKLREALNDHTVFVSIMYANNEVGTVQPIAEISKIIRSKRGEGMFPLFHTDAVQAFQFLDCNVEKLGVDLMTLSAHKIYGPKGVGALYIRASHESRITNNAVSPILTGGGQEFGLRSGTENVAGIAGFAEAVRGVAKIREREGRRIAALRQELWRGVKKIFPKAQVNGVSESRIKNQESSFLPNILNVYFPKLSAAEFVVRLDLAGIAVSAGPACSSRSAEPSQVLRALGLSSDRSAQSIRFSLGKYTSSVQIREVIRRLRTLL